MVEVNINSIDTRLAPRIIAIYAVINKNKAYIGKSTDALKRLEYHKTNIEIKDGAKFYILEAFKEITDFDLMLMEDIYICNFKAIGYKLINTADAIPPRIRKFLMRKRKKVKLYKQFQHNNMKSSIYKFEIKENQNGTKYVYHKE